MDHRSVSWNAGNLETNNIRMHFVEAGEGPLIVLLHGFPEGWYSWRHQIPVLAAAGYHVVVPDQRGYGQTDVPVEVHRYSMLHLVGDVVGLIRELGEETAILVGHDWGASVAWNTALLRPDLVKAVVALSVPLRPRISKPPLDFYREALGDRFYQIYFQEPGVAERELEADIRHTMRAILCGESGEASRVPDLLVSDRGFLDTLEILDPLPPWLSEIDLDHWASVFARSGFSGGLNWYRNLNANWELLAPWAGAAVGAPALYVVGDRDDVYQVPGVTEFVVNLRRLVPRLTEMVVLEGCGHWTQQERPADVNDSLLDFLRRL